ncbi:MAG: Gfo/Idh/MocA family oxidoreductase [Lentisphaerae bacterium]|jgi:predicted dehydrogenase|nr:Gfo/Idh/MocA family oxidoreductase [Lentisphaerota bacterium]
MRKIKVGQIGITHEHAAVKMASMRRLTDSFEIVGVVDDRHSSAPRFIGNDLQAYAGLPWLTERELLEVEGLQAVMVETANGDLVPTALRCMERGVAIHMDKPGGTDLALFKELRQNCEARAIPFQMGYMFRNNPALMWIRKAVKAGWLGPVFKIEADMNHDYGGDAYQEYIGALEGGVMFNLGCHLIDFIVALMGRPVSVVPFLKSAPEERSTPANNCLAVLEYAAALATVSASSRVVGGLPRRGLKIDGLNGSVKLAPLERFDGQPFRLNLELKKAIPGYNAGVHTLDFGITTDRYAAQLLEWAAEIRGDAKPQLSAMHDTLVYEVVLAAAGVLPWQK